MTQIQNNRSLYPQLFHHLKKFIQKESLESRVCVVAVSGGVDSMLLLHLMADLKRKDKLNNVIALYVDHQQRPSLDIKKDLKCIQTMCKCFDIELISRKLDFDCQDSKLINKNIEYTLRQKRIKIFENICSERQGILLTAHHMDDQVETFFMRLFQRGSIGSLKGMRENNQNQMYKPLLSIQKKHIAQAASEKNIVFNEDSTNTNENLLRNSFRRKLLPSLDDQFSPSYRGRVASMQDYLWQLEDIVQDIADKVFVEALTEDEQLNSDKIKIERDIIQKKILEKMAEKKGFHLSEKHLDSVLKMLTKKKSLLKTETFAIEMIHNKLMFSKLK